MDIRSQSVSATARLHLCNSSDELMYDTDGKAVAVNVYSPGSKQYAKADAIRQNRIMDMVKRKGKVDQSAEQKREESARFLSDCTESFENLSYDDLTGHDLSMAVYSDASIGFIADQVAKFIGDWSNFSKPAATT